MARRHVFRTWDDYFIPGTSVLRNLFVTPSKPYGETDAAKLRALEEGAAAIRLGLRLVDFGLGGFTRGGCRACQLGGNGSGQRRR